MKLRDYQQDIFEQALKLKTNVLIQLETGGGKTPIIAALSESSELSIIVAHRNILITQASEKLAAFGLYHDTISTEYTRRRCMASHRKHNKNYIKRGHEKRLVASIDSLIAWHRRGLLTIDTLLPWLILIDEAHHVVKENKWGSLRDIFPNARFIGVTATPGRPDGESLHISKGGLFESLVQATLLKENGIVELIKKGNLCEFVVYSPASEIYNSNRKEVFVAADIVDAYKNIANGKQAVVMCPMILNAEDIARDFKSSGVSAASISSKMPASSVARVLDAFIAKRIQVLCNVDMVSEGFDVPGIEVLIMSRFTKSFIAYKQWIGRPMRPAQGKERAIIIDLVGNIEEHGMPHTPVKWDLLNPPKGMGNIKHCPCSDCGVWYKLKLLSCPECGAKNKIYDRENTGLLHVNIKCLDVGLIQARKLEIAEEERVDLFKTEIIYPSISAHGLVNSVINKIRKWFVEQLLSEGVSIYDINTFLAKNASVAMWRDSFTISDISKPNVRKCLVVYKKWQK